MSETEAARSLGVAETRSRLDGLTIEVPGSTSNLGAGFDALAIAVRLYVRVTVTRVDDRERNRVRSTFNGVTLEGDDYVARSVTTLAARDGVDFPALQLEIASEIPMQAGLGSSAAATVAGLRLYQSLTDGFSGDLLVEGTRFEGHPDNVAASVLGGLTVACDTTDGGVLAVSSPWPEDVRLVAVTPDAAGKDTGGAARAARHALARRRHLQPAARGAPRRRSEQRPQGRPQGGAPGSLAPAVPGAAGARPDRGPRARDAGTARRLPQRLWPDRHRVHRRRDTGDVERAFRGVYEKLGLGCTVRVLTAHNGPTRLT